MLRTPGGNGALSCLNYRKTKEVLRLSNGTKARWKKPVVLTTWVKWPYKGAWKFVNSLWSWNIQKPWRKARVVSPINQEKMNGDELNLW